jgi:hypothetical protein
MGDHHLTVVRDFGDHKRGARIEDEAEIARILGGELRHHVVKIHATRKPEAAAEKSAGTPPALPKSDEKDPA